MNAIHFNVEAAEAFCRDVAARSEALAERMGDERLLYETVFDSWRDHRGQGLKARLDELTRTTQNLSSDLNDLVATVRQQIRAAQEFLDGPEVW